MNQSIPEDALGIYKDQWQIETVFNAIKNKWFCVEDTHLTEMERIEKPFELVIIAFIWAYLVRDYLDQMTNAYL